MAKQQYESKTIVLKNQIDERIAKQLVEEKKTKVFHTPFTRPKNDEVHIHSLKLYYEAILLVSGKYVADYYRKAIHTITVDHNVKEVVIGDGIFSIRKKSGLAKVFSVQRKNKIDLELEEHVFIDEQGQLALDHYGKNIRFPFKIDSKTIENYPKRILEKNEPNVKPPELKHDAAINMLSKKLKKPPRSDVRDLNDELIVKEIAEVYVPIYEARLIGPKKKVKILRIDAVRNKVL